MISAHQPLYSMLNRRSALTRLLTVLLTQTNVELLLPHRKKIRVKAIFSAHFSWIPWEKLLP